MRAQVIYRSEDFRILIEPFEQDLRARLEEIQDTGVALIHLEEAFSSYALIRLNWRYRSGLLDLHCPRTRHKFPGTSPD